MNKVKIEAFLSVPTCSGGVSLSKLLEEIKKEYGSRVDIVPHKGRNELFEKYNLTTAPALVIGGLVRIMGLCPSKESLISALKEAGLE
ncbi:MAG: thioredoxin family protein [Dehalococcoidales bacterium]|nr:thioredoxin family protein [Dehalococcoidales bacterium]